MDTTQTYIGLGANLGEAATTLRQAAAELAATPGIGLMQMSRLYRSTPVGSTGPDYLNAVAAVCTTLDAQSLLAALQQIELNHGRVRPYRNAPRTLDLDLLLYGNQTIDLPELTVPHPRMHQRAFVLAPLLELVPDLELAQGPVQTLLEACAGQFIQAVD